MIFQSEFNKKNKTAHIFKIDSGYVIICYDNGNEHKTPTFEDYESAETFAESFVAGTIDSSGAELSQEQQTAVTRGCCD